MRRRAAASGSLAACRAPAPVSRRSTSRPTLLGVKTVDVFRRVDRGDDASVDRYARGSGNCTRMPSTRSSRLSLASSAARSACEMSAGKRISKAASPEAVARPAFGAHIDLAGPVVADQNRGETRGNACSLAQARRDLADSQTQLGSDRAAVDDRCAPHPALLGPAPLLPTLPKGTGRGKAPERSSGKDLSACRGDGWRGSRRARAPPRSRGRRSC